tara:strand:- start:265 stop:2226 length:1962 start_codon:yes stop_codon:yes gene_type:complete
MNFISQKQYSSSDEEKPLEACEAVGEIPSLKEPKLIGDFVFWLEQRPNERGRITALTRPWMQNNLEPQELTPFPINLKTRIHGYGGGAFTVCKEADLILISWIDDCDGCLWVQSFSENGTGLEGISNYLKQLNNPICLSKKGKFFLANGLIDYRRKRWLGVMEKESHDYIVQFSIDKELQKPLILYKAKDFLAYLNLSPQSNYLSWIEWNKPNMPWDSSEIRIAEFDEKGQIFNTQIFNGQRDQADKPVSIFQPIWLSSGEIVASEDQTGWWNVILGSKNDTSDEDFSWSRLWPMDAETAMPQWVCGMSTIAAAGEKIIVAVCREGSWEICLFTKQGLVSVINQPFNDLVGVDAQEDRVLAIAGNFSNNLGLIEIDLKTNNWKYSSPIKLSTQKKKLSKPKSFWFIGCDNQRTHSWYYPPIGEVNKCAPLLVRSHSGPTAMARTSMNLEIQYWTSRGWGVLDVNYGGSTGFGKSYRERLKNSWGQVDVSDCILATQSLIDSGKADKDFIAIEGSSAGGFTTLSCLYMSKIFKVAACKYPVTDLLEMSKSTHRFEAYYLNYLIGKLPSELELYIQRSPISNVDKIITPVIFFQGLKDKVVDPLQTEKMYNKLLSNNLPVELHLFEKEGHGFKDAISKVKVLELTENFFKQHLNN